MTKQNNTTFQAQEQTALAAVDKYYSGVSSLTIGGTSYTPAAVKKVLSDDLAAQAALAPQRATLHVAVTSAQAVRATARALLKALRVHIVDQYGTQSAPVLADFGYAPASSTKPTILEKVQAVDKRIATRKARHTMGKKQKKAITGTVPAETVGEGTATAASASK
jgi:hypothetical protein